MEIRKKVMLQATWQQILEDVRAGEAAKYVGTEIKITLKNGTTAVLAVAAINHYKDNELVFVFRDYLSKRRQMNEEGTNAGGWKKSDLRKWLNKEFIKLLPDDLQEVIHKKKTMQIVDGECHKCKDYLFLPSETEMFGECEYSEGKKGEKQFPYYIDIHNRSRTMGENGCWGFGWLSSLSVAGDYCLVNGYGYADYSIDTCDSHGVAPAFLIR